MRAGGSRAVSALRHQVGGHHYNELPIQSVEFMQRNALGYCAGNVIKYVCRHRSKNGAQVLRKAIHYLELLLAIEYGEPQRLLRHIQMRPTACGVGFRVALYIDTSPQSEYRTFGHRRTCSLPT